MAAPMETDPASVRSAIVRAMKLQFATETGWCQNAYARNTEGRPVDDLSDDAVSCCLRSGVWRGALRLGFPLEVVSGPANTIMIEIERLIGNSSILSWNDNWMREFSDVRAVIEQL